MEFNASYKSFQDKILNHVKLRKKEPIPPNLCNKVTPVWYLLTLIWTWIVAQSVVFPQLYSTWPIFIYSQRILSTILMLEIMVNWYYMRNVKSIFDSRYNSSNSVDKCNTSDFELDLLNDRQSDFTLAEKDDNGKDDYIVYVASSLSGKELYEPERKPYPYWSWKPCLICNHQRPPRCHHCPLCEVCVLKRDHHCYFTGSCIGLYNQRHFTVFIFWGSIGTLYALVHALPFFYYDVFNSIIYADLFLPFTLIRFTLGYISLRSTALTILIWSIAIFACYSIAFLYDQIILIATSQTSFERQYGIKICDSRNIGEKLVSVFGKQWWINFLMPVHWYFGLKEDPINWPTIKK